MEGKPTAIRRPFGMRDNLAYAAGDFGCNMSFALKGTLVIFWTQYMGMNSLLYAALLLVVQVWDAINDPLIGALIDADRRRYKLGKFKAYIFAGSIGLVVVGALCSVVACALLLVLPVTPDTTGLIIYMGCMLINSLGMGVYSCVSWSLMADAIDYNQWRFGVREEGTVYSLHSFFRKLAQGLGPSLVLVIMVALGYVEANQGSQTPDVALNMRYLVAGLYLFSALMQFVSLAIIYNIDKKTLAHMNAELEARRAEELAEAATEDAGTAAEDAGAAAEDAGTAAEDAGPAEQ